MLTGKHWYRFHFRYIKGIKIKIYKILFVDLEVCLASNCISIGKKSENYTFVIKS